MTLPTILPASSIPSILKECHRTLVSPSLPTVPTSYLSNESSTGRGGVLHLTLLDPSPIPETLGPRLRTWLDTNLMLNLERQFRCLNPIRLFPIWLADAGLRAEGSTIVRVRFQASLPSNGSRISPTGTALIDEIADKVKNEMKSVVGRLLWKDMWGSYVEGDRWWWEDKVVVEECERLGTAWEYAIIEAVKEG
jgi:hypothetical protein